MMHAMARGVGLGLALWVLPAVSAAGRDAACGGVGGGETKLRSVLLAGSAAGRVAPAPAAAGAPASCRTGDEPAAAGTGISGLDDRAWSGHLARPFDTEGDDAERTGTEAALAEAEPRPQASLPPLTVGHVAVDLYGDIAVMSPDERLAYVTGHQEESIVVIDLLTLTIQDRFPVPDRVWGLAISPDGRRLFVSSTPFAAPIADPCSGMAIPGASSSHLFILDARSGALLKVLPLPGQTFTLLPSPDGKRLAALSSIGIELIDLASETVVASLAAPPGVNAIAEGAFDADGAKIFAASGAQGVVVFDLVQGSARSLRPPAGYALLGLGLSGVPERNEVFTTLTNAQDDDALGVVDTATEEVRAVPPPSNALGGVLFVQSRSRLFMPSSANVLAAGTLKEVGELPLFYFGTGLVGQLSPDESILYVRPVSARIDSLTLFSRPVQYDLLAIDTATLRPLAHVNLSRGAVRCTRPTPLVLGASGQIMVAPNPALRTVSIVKACSPAHPAAACTRMR
jgi:hypothetical protein